MDETLEKSLRSILDQVSTDYEVLVVDDGSTDDSVDILSKLASEYEQLRYVALKPNPSRHLGGTRQVAVEESRGEYIMTNLDTDDVYERGIQDFAYIYHQIESVREQPFFLKGYGINMAPRTLLLDIPFRNVQRIDDKDLWRRLFANDAIVWFEHDPFWKEIATPRGRLDKMRNAYHAAVAEFKSGITFPSFVSYQVDKLLGRGFGNRQSGAYELTVAPVAFLNALRQDRMSLPDGYSRKGQLKEEIAERRRTLTDLEAEYDFEIDRKELRDVGRKAFYPDTPSPVEWASVLDNPERSLGT